MIRVGILGDIGSGKTLVSKCFRLPTFNADKEVKQIYKTNKDCFKKLNKKFPKNIKSFPIKKSEIRKILNKSNIKILSKIVHPYVRFNLKKFLKKNKKKKIIILDIPLLLENKLNKKSDILIFIKTKKIDVSKRLKRRKNFNKKLIEKFRKIQLPLAYKEKKSHYIIKNNFTKKSIKEDINNILGKIR